MIEGGIDLDLEAVRQNVREAEVICLYFPTLRRTLLVDTRSNDQDGTFIKVVPQARNTADRFRSIRRLRPFFGRPESITMIPWEWRVSSLVTLGVWEPLLERVDDHAAATSCLERLRYLELRERRAAITGQRYTTLYARVRVDEE